MVKVVPAKNRDVLKYMEGAEMVTSELNIEASKYTFALPTSVKSMAPVPNLVKFLKNSFPDENSTSLSAIIFHRQGCKNHQLIQNTLRHFGKRSKYFHCILPFHNNSNKFLACKFHIAVEDVST